MKPCRPALARIFFAVLALTAQASSIQVIVVAGQSNALNWHASAADLGPDGRDAGIAFYYETGAPPARGEAGLNATSGGKWTTLRAQRQQPYVKFERDFFGPEISLARQLSTVMPRLAVIKLAYFGTNLANDWSPSATTGNRLHHRLAQQVAGALQQLRARGAEPRVAGFFWMQGETDGASAAHAAAYGENLTAFIGRVRADFGDDSLPFVLGRVGPRPPRGYEHQDLVRAAQVRAAQSTPHAAWVDTDDLPRDTDGIHLRGSGVMTLGERMAEAWVALQRNRPQK